MAGEATRCGTVRGPGARPLILVVDDSADMRRLVADVLSSVGYEVAGVPSGAAALRFMAQQTPDVLVTDLFMPGMSGFGLRTAMLRRPELARIPVIVLSAYWRPGQTLAAAAALPKPVNIDRLIEAVQRVLASVPDEPAPRAGSPAHEPPDERSVEQPSA